LRRSEEVYHRFHLPEIAKDKKLLQAWCRKNKDKKLYELQIEMCKWAIGEINEFDHKALAKPTAIREIERTIETLERTRVPVSSSRSF